MVLLFLLSSPVWALHIENVSVAQTSGQSINVSLTTAAEELYYFQSWEYSVSGNQISIEALFVSGFGSTIISLNNNFEIPLVTKQPSNYGLSVKIFYKDDKKLELQDEAQLWFALPILHAIELTNQHFDQQAGFRLYPNPTNGNLEIPISVDSAVIFDDSGQQVKVFRNILHTIYLSDLAEGIYKIMFSRGMFQISKTIILKK